MREEQVQQGVNFLNHPKVKESPLSQRVAFLEKKALTHEEISECLSRCEGRDSSNATQLRGAEPMGPPPPPPPPAVPLWRRWAVPSVLALGGLGAVGVWHQANRAEANRAEANRAEANGVGQGGSEGGQARVGGSGERDTQAVGDEEQQQQQQQQQPSTAPPQYAGDGDPVEREAAAEPTHADAAALGEAVAAMKVIAERLDPSGTGETGTAVALAEIRTDLETIKQLLLLQGAGGVSGSVEQQASTREAVLRAAVAAVEGGAADDSNGEGQSAAADIPESLTAEEAEAKALQKETKEREEKEAAALEAERAEEALKAEVCVRHAERLAAVQEATQQLWSGNSEKELKSALPMLKLFVTNLLNHPTVPRYRKITTTNKNFKTLVAPLEAHVAFLTACGFKEKGGNTLEWEWLHPAGGEGEAVKNKAVMQAAMEALDVMVAGKPPPAAAQEEAAQAEAAQSEAEAVSKPSMSSSVSSLSGAAPEYVPTAAVVAGVVAEVEEQEQQTSGGGQDSGVEQGQEQRAPGGDAAVDDTAAESSSSPKYPETFAEVMAVVGRGESPPGIANVSDDDGRLASNAPAAVSAAKEGLQPPVAKPWEVPTATV